MASYFTYENMSSDKELNKIGGDSLLPLHIDWPLDNAGRKMLFLASVSSVFLKVECGIIIEKENIISIFCPYKRGSIEPAFDMTERPGSSRVISHLPGDLRQECEAPIVEGRRIDLDKSLDTDEDEFSGDIDDKFGGVPNWLQDTFDYSGYEFVMQINGSTFNEVFPSHVELCIDGILYVFYDSSLNEGLVNLQYS